jgi:hypothetical protein
VSRVEGAGVCGGWGEGWGGKERVGIVMSAQGDDYWAGGGRAGGGEAGGSEAAMQACALLAC